MWLQELGMSSISSSRFEHEHNREHASLDLQSHLAICSSAFHIHVGLIMFAWPYLREEICSLFVRFSSRDLVLLMLVVRVIMRMAFFL